MDLVCGPEACNDEADHALAADSLIHSPEGWGAGWEAGQQVPCEADYVAGEASPLRDW